MRVKSKVFSLVIALCLLPTTVFAGTAEDLYKLYGKEFTVKYPESITRTISRYQNAKKYAAMYQYVITSEYDNSILQKRADDLRESISTAESTLLNGYNMSLEDIYTAEETYRDSVHLLASTEKAMETDDVQYTLPETKDIPSYVEYCNAKTLKSCYDSYNNIGSLDSLTYPVDSACLVEYVDNSKLKLTTVQWSVMHSLFNGTVVDVKEDNLTISHHNGIYTYYGGLSDISVKVDEEVKQGQPIGYSSGHIVLRMKVDNEIVNVSKLFER